jgi:Flp pilus assembly protein TadD
MTSTVGRPTNRGSFQKGQSGNPGGRPKALAPVRDLARAQTEAAIETLVAIMTDTDASASARVAAATAILDRGWGKPTVQVETSVQRDLKTMTDEELLAIIQAAKDEEEAVL